MDNLKDIPAFPSIDAGDTHYPGLSLRDYFAAKAIQGMLSNSSVVRSDGAFSEKNVRTAYEIADAMIHFREFDSFGVPR